MFKLVNRSGDAVTYEARLWDGEKGRHYTATCRDRIMRTPDGKPRGLLNTSRNVSYYSQLTKALGI